VLFSILSKGSGKHLILYLTNYKGLTQFLWVGILAYIQVTKINKFNKLPSTRHVSIGRSFDTDTPGTACVFENKLAISSGTVSTM